MIEKRPLAKLQYWAAKNPTGRAAYILAHGKTEGDVVLVDEVLQEEIKKDVYKRQHRAIVRDLTMRQGRQFLTREKMNRYSTLARSSAAQAGVYLCRMAEPLVSLLWHLTLSLIHI